MKPSTSGARENLRVVLKSCELAIFGFVTLFLIVAGLWTMIDILMIRTHPAYVLAVAAGLIASPLVLLHDLVKRLSGPMAPMTDHAPEAEGDTVPD